MVILIGANSPGGVKLRDDNWTLVISAVARRISSTEVEQKSLRLEMPVSHSALKKHMRRLAAYQIVEVELADGWSENPIQISRIVKTKAKDNQLSELAQQLQETVTISDDVLGELVLDRRFGSFTGSIDWAGQQIGIDLQCESPEKPDSAIAAFKELLNELDDWDEKVNSLATDKLLGLKNDSWLEEGESEITAADFRSRMSLQTISIDFSGEFSFWFNDGDLFWGHAITVSGNMSDGPRFADIAG